MPAQSSKSRFILPCSILMVIAVGYIDAVTDAELSFAIFYLVPIYWASWRLGRWPGFAVAMLAAGTWLAAELVEGMVYHYPWAPYWNMAVRLGFFLITAYLLAELQQSRQRRRMLERVFFHDLLNLTGSLRGFAELLQQDAVPDRSEVVRALGMATERVVDEIEDQQLLCAAESGDLQVDREPVNTGELLANVKAIYRQHRCAHARHIVLESPVDEVVVLSDQVLLVRILGNLVKNALEATPMGGRVRLGCQVENGAVCFRVSNPGVIAAADRARLFTARPSAKGRHRGVGTYSVKLLSAAIGARVEVASDAVQGTLFTLRLPLPPVAP